ncbi:TetR/AcrR family transcriptional regulator, partial|nr:TetR/AcrR family transcriptional regulator [Escherichia coli]
GITILSVDAKFLANEPIDGNASIINLLITNLPN